MCGNLLPPPSSSTALDSFVSFILCDLSLFPQRNNGICENPYVGQTIFCPQMGSNNVREMVGLIHVSHQFYVVVVALASVELLPVYTGVGASRI